MRKIFFLLCFLFFISYSFSQELKQSNKDYLEKGIALVNDGKYEEALPFIYQAISTDNKNPDLYRLLGQILEILEKTDEATNAWEMCLSLTTDDNLKKEAKLHIEALKK